MAGNYCLPKKYTQPFFDALSSGKLDRVRISKMSSDARRAEFEKYMPKDHALTVNELFEEKLLLKDREKGITNWTNQVLGNNTPAARDIVSKIQKNRKLLTPEGEKDLLHDVAEKKFGVDVTAVEANEIFDLSKRAKELESVAKEDLTNIPNRIAWGRAIQDVEGKIKDLSPDARTGWNKLYDVIGVPKSLQSTFDLSAFFNQGWGMLSTKEGLQGLPKMLKYFKNEENFRDMMAQIVTDPDYQTAKSAKLGLVDMGDSLFKREDAFQSPLLDTVAEGISEKTGIVNPVAASSRAYVGYLNFVRFNRFKTLLNAAKLAGEDVRLGSQVTKELANVVNDFTGRGHLGKGDRLGNSAPFLNSIMWAPRKLSASINMFNPKRYLDPNVSPTARKAAARQLVGSLAVTGAILGLLKSAGADVSIDPRSQKFGQACFGDTCFDFTGGNRTLLRLYTRMILSTINTVAGTEFPEVVNSKGEEQKLRPGFGPGTQGQEPVSFIRGKFAPVASVLTDIAVGSDGIGQPFTLSKEAKRMIPMTFSSFIELMENDEDNMAAWMMTPFTILGAGMDSRGPRLKQGLTKWGTEPNSDTEEMENKIDEALKAISTKDQKVEWGFLPKTINGVKLTDDQYHDYLVMAGARVKEELNEVINSPEWELTPVEERAAYVKNNIFRPARAQVLSTIINNSAEDNDGQGNDLFEKSDETFEDVRTGSSKVDRADKKIQETLKAPVTSEKDLEKQWSEMMLKNYDYGRMKTTNPTAYLGFVLNKTDGGPKYYKTPLTALGMTISDNLTDADERDDPLLSQVLKEAGIDPKKSKNAIILGPEFARGENTNTLEHELMHRGMNEIFEKFPDLKADQETAIRAFQDKYGYDKHGSERQANWSDTDFNWRDGLSEKEKKEAKKDLRDMKADLMVSIQKKAEELIKKKGL